MKKKCIALLMAMVVVVSTGCGAKAPEVSNEPVADAGVVDEGQPAEEESGEFVYDVVLTDYEAKNTVTIGTSDGATIYYDETPVKVEVADNRFELYEYSDERNAEFHYWDGERNTILKVQHSWNEVPEDLGHDIYVRNFEKDERLFKSFQYGDIDGCYQYYVDNSDPSYITTTLFILEDIGQADYLTVEVSLPGDDYSEDELLKEYLFKVAE